MGFTKKESIFFCDCCPETFPNGQGLINLEVPVRVYDEKGESYTRQLKKVALCMSCFNKFWEASDENFAVVEVGIRETKFYPHFETEPEPCRDFHWVGEEEVKPKERTKANE